MHHGPEGSIFLVFIFSGLMVQSRQIIAGMADAKGTAASLAITFLVAPAIARLWSVFPLPESIYTGIILIAIMPSTLSSGVIMTGLAGGNSIHALLITILGNIMAIFTIPVTLQWLMSGDNIQTGNMEFAQSSLMLKIALLVVIPLAVGVTWRKAFPTTVKRFTPYAGIFSQISILFIIWMAICNGKNDVVQGGIVFIAIILLSTGLFHCMLILVGMYISHLCDIHKGRRESVIIMGGQKTLPLSLIIQSSLFPDLGLAAVTCVLHHILHLAVDAFLVQYLKQKGNCSQRT